MSSELLPHLNNHRLALIRPHDYQQYQIETFEAELKAAGQLAKKYNQRLTFHPGQYNVLASPNQTSFENTIKDLDKHARILDIMELPRDSIMVIHGGGFYKNLDHTKQVWIERYLKLPSHIRDRLVLENCEKCFSIKDCLDVSHATNIPIVLDNHHYFCYQQMHPEESFEPIDFYIPQVLETWSRANIRPKFHISEQACGGKIGKHSDMISELPDYYLEIPKLYQVDLDIMVEAKLKEQAIFQLYQKHPILQNF